MSTNTAGFNDLAANPGTSSRAYLQALRAVYYRGAISGRVPDPAKAPRDDAAWWRKALRDPTIRKAVAKRCYAVAGREWRIHPASETRADDKTAALIVEDAFRSSLRFFDRARALLATAIFRGSAYDRIYGERRFVQLGVDAKGAPLPPRWWWVPTDLEDVDPLRFEKRKDVAGVLRWHFGSVSGEGANNPFSFDTWQVLENPEHFVRHVHEPTEQSLGYGNGIQDALEFPLWAKQELWRQLLSAARRAGSGFFDVAIDGLRAGSTTEEADEIVGEWKDTLNVAREDGDLIHAKDDEVKLLPMPLEGMQVIRSAISDLKEEITGLILFGLLPTGDGSSSNGSMARANVEDDSGREAFHFEQAALSESITHSLVSIFWQLNRENFNALTLGAARQPRFEIGNVQRPDPVGTAQVLALLAKAGLAKYIRVDEALGACGFTPAKGTEATLSPDAVATDAEVTPPLNGSVTHAP